MGRLASIVLLWAGMASVASADSDLGLLLEGRLLSVSDSPGWLDGDLGKLRYGEQGGVVDLAQGFFTLDYRGSNNLGYHLVAGYDSKRDDGLDVTEAFIHWRPVPTGPTRHRLTVGAFYPALSEENPDRAWLSPYGLSNSAINSWIGEELRAIGLEYRLERPGRFLGSAHDWSLTGAVFMANDTAGTLLSWRGWAIHDRQTGVFDRLPLADLPAFQDGEAFERQVHWVEPVREIDDSPGYYLGGRWDYLDRVGLHLHYYDNRADPLALEVREGSGYSGGASRLQYAWHTRFWHLGWRAELPGSVELFGQWLTGRTIMGAGDTLVDNDFEAAYMMLSRAFGSHRLSLRRDVFRVDDRDQTPADDNNERGNAWALAWRWRLGEHWQLGAEWLRVESRRPIREALGEAPRRTESLLQFAVQYRL